MIIEEIILSTSIFRLTPFHFIHIEVTLFLFSSTSVKEFWTQDNKRLFWPLVRLYVCVPQNSYLHVFSIGKCHKELKFGISITFRLRLTNSTLYVDLWVTSCVNPSYVHDISIKAWHKYLKFCMKVYFFKIASIRRFRIY